MFRVARVPFSQRKDGLVFFQERAPSVCQGAKNTAEDRQHTIIVRLKTALPTLARDGTRVPAPASFSPASFEKQPLGRDRGGLPDRVGFPPLNPGHRRDGGDLHDPAFASLGEQDAELLAAA